jgi:hypothetical protein
MFQLEKEDHVAWLLGVVGKIMSHHWVTYCAGPYNNSSPFFLIYTKTNRKNLPIPILAQNWAKFAFLD